MFTSTALCVCTAGFIVASLASGQTVALRSGNGPVGGADNQVTFLLGPPTGPFDHPFTSADFASAQSGPAAFIVSPNPLWISGLSSDPSTHWIGTNSSAGTLQGNTALYAVSFQLASPFTSATLTLNYAVDDAIGDTVIDKGPNTGVYLNGSATCGGAFVIGFSQQHSVSCGDVSSLLHIGTNWLYVEDGNVEGAAGLLFSATITTTTLVGPTITPGGIVNAGSYTSPIAPGSIASAFGTFPVSSPVAAPSVPGANWPTTLAGLSMQFGSVPAPLYYVSSDHLNFQVPWEADGPSTAEVTVNANGETSSPQFAAIASYAPSIFAMNGQGTGQGAIIDGNYRLVDTSNPAVPGKTVIAIYCTGLGAVTNQPATGAPAPTDVLAETTVKPLVTVGGAQATVLFSGLAPGWVGEYQVNASVPASSQLGQAVPVTLSIGGVQSNTVTIAVEPLTQPNPQPSITSLSPASAQAGSSPLMLMINGTGFISSSSVTFNGIPYTASFVSSGQLTITLSASDLATAGSFAVVVTNPPPGGGSSNTGTFSVSPMSVPVPPVPTGLSPGSNEPPGVTVNTLTPTLSWNSSPGATGYVVAMLNNATGAAILAQTVSATSILCPTLASGVTYVWSVAAYNSSGRSAISTPMYFTVATAQTGLTGTWQGTWGSILDSLEYGGLSASLIQNGSAVTGTITLTSSSCVPGGDVSGTIEGNTLSLDLLVGPPQPQAIFSGTLDASGNSILGVYKVYLGACAGDYGVFTAKRSN